MPYPLIRPAARRSLAQVRYIGHIPPAAATGPVAAVYEETEKEFGVLAPPVAMHAPQPALLAAAWTMLRETLVAEGTMDRAQKEAVAAAVSAANSCPYCVEVHGSVLNTLVPGSHLPGQDTRRALPSGELRRLAEWATGPRGGQRSPAPAPGQLPEALGVAVVFHYLNRMVNVFLEPSPLPARIPGAARGPASRLFAAVLARGARAHREPGRSLGLLPPAALPGDFGWAGARPTVADAFARAAKAIATAGENTVPVSVRTLVTEELSGWDGTPKPLVPDWLNKAESQLPPEDRPAGRLALLTAFASYRVDETVIAPVLHSGSGDASLLTLVAWSAFTAARRHGALLVPPSEPATATPEEPASL
ncbi:MAG TPA: carboxymuconolactone decarboxylase family protein [Streptomyces sp.]|uniref:carboxymuconolactone decarboxylase family protein n=1 Tax=Streptomyces sp. TaxID=1931 RepID=UPI002CAC90D0|nr:carboxymuconolactone decarboxylase family protein [Streptomyces sp.]HWU11101.1 carboxymuconolactone decarboxylase family protein [Streptomyces sp.]